MSDSEVIKRILAGEERLFARIVERYSGYVWALCASYVRNPSDCEDLSQEVFVQCYRRLDTLRNPAALGAWLSQLARRQCLMWLRSNARRERRETAFGQTAEAVSAPSEELRENLARAIETLPAVYREALLLRYAEGYSIAQAAAFLGITPAALRKRVERGQRMMKDMLWEQVEPALSHRKHKEHLAGALVAAIPFGDAPWLHAAATSSAGAAGGTKLAVIGGIVMGKKIAIGIAALVVVIGAVWYGTRTATDTGDTANTIPPTPSAEGFIDVAEETAAVPVADSEPAAAPTVAATPAEDADPVVQPASVSGHVKSHDGAPISGAEVILEIAKDGDRNDIAEIYRATAGADGGYRIGGIDVFDDVVVYASADGYTMGFNHKVKIGEGINAQNVDVTLEPAAYYVAGYVRTQSRQPVAGASVDTMYYGYDEAGLEVTAATGRTTGNIGGIKLKFAITDSKGYFMIGLANDGLCDLRVVKEGYGPAFFPQIPAGTDDADLVLRAGGAIGGRITTSDNKPVAGQRVVAQGEVLPGGLMPSEVKIQKLPSTPASTTTDSSGDYVIEGLGEDYTYTVAVAGRGEEDLYSLPTDQGLRTIAKMMVEFNENVFDADNVAVQKSDVHVKSGQTTRVDLVLGKANSGVIYGKVTDRTTGQPVCPVVITAGAGAETGGLRAAMHTDFGGTAVTGLAGTYRLTVPNLEKKISFTISHSFMTEGGSAWEQPQEVAATVDVGPGEEIAVNLVVDAPVTVPVQYVNIDGSPREGVLAAMRTAGGGGGCGGTLISGTDGRVTFHGIRPGMQLQAIAWIDMGGGVKTIGASDPFQGQPGETMAEVLVVCRNSGGIAGAIALPDGRAAANAAVLAVATLADGSLAPMEGPITTDANGAFVLEQAFPENTYAFVALGFLAGDPTLPYSVMVPNVTIVADEVTDLGVVTTAIERDLARVVQAVGYDTKSNEAIAAIYSADALPTLQEPGLALKTGMALYDVGRYEEALDAFRHMAGITEPDSIYTPISLIWQGQMLDLLGRHDNALPIYQNVAAMGITSPVRHDQFGLAYNPSEYAQELAEHPFQRVENQY